MLILSSHSLRYAPCALNSAPSILNGLNAVQHDAATTWPSPAQVSVHALANANSATSRAFGWRLKGL